jgi:spore coat polysaccharide biosynthesis protein SpsF (cytidylyltransferase family)
MLKDKKIIILIAVRMKSTRLPKKALLLIEDKTVLEHLFERLRLSKLADDVVVCTSTNAQDDVLEEAAKKNGIKYFRGSEENILERFIQAAEREKAEIIVRVTGDNVFTDPIYIDKMIEHHIKNQADYTRTEGLAQGIRCEVMSVSALKKILRLAERPDHSEYLTWFFTKNPKFFKIAILPVLSEHCREFRLTMDEPEDYELIKIIFKNLYKKGEKPFLWPEIIDFLDKNSDLLKINAQIQAKDFSRMEKEINVNLREE